MKKRVARKLREFSQYVKQSEKNLKAQWNRIPHNERQGAERAMDAQLVIFRERKVEIQEKRGEYVKKKRALQKKGSLTLPTQRPNPKRKSALAAVATMAAMVRP